MPPNPQVNTIEVDEAFLPYPATQLIITQYLEADPSRPLWAWIIVGAFLDEHGSIIWSTELFLAHLDVQLESVSGDISDGEEQSDFVNAGQEPRFTSPGQSVTNSYTAEVGDAKSVTLHRLPPVHPAIAILLPFPPLILLLCSHQRA